MKRCDVFVVGHAETREGSICIESTCFSGFLNCKKIEGSMNLLFFSWIFRACFLNAMFLIPMEFHILKGKRFAT